MPSGAAPTKNIYLFRRCLLGVELGIWQGQFQNAELPWLRWWDNQGHLLLTGSERAEETELLLQEEHKLLEQERQKMNV